SAGPPARRAPPGPAAPRRSSRRSRATPYLGGEVVRWWGGGWSGFVLGVCPRPVTSNHPTTSPPHHLTTSPPNCPRKYRTRPPPLPFPLPATPPLPITQPGGVPEPQPPRPSAEVSF